MPEQRDVTDKGGTMRLGIYPCMLGKNSKSYAAYGNEIIYERHRHRYEFSNDFREAFQKAGMQLTGISPDGKLVEIIELPELKWYVGVQFHPEFKSRPNRAHPLFREFIKAALEK
jgi:CTP synthase